MISRDGFNIDGLDLYYSTAVSYNKDRDKVLTIFVSVKNRFLEGKEEYYCSVLKGEHMDITSLKDVITNEDYVETFVISQANRNSYLEPHKSLLNKNGILKIQNGKCIFIDYDSDFRYVYGSNDIDNLTHMSKEYSYVTTLYRLENSFSIIPFKGIFTSVDTIIHIPDKVCRYVLDNYVDKYFNDFEDRFSNIGIAPYLTNVDDVEYVNGLPAFLVPSYYLIPDKYEYEKEFVAEYLVLSKVEDLNVKVMFSIFENGVLVTDLDDVENNLFILYVSDTEDQNSGYVAVRVNRIKNLYLIDDLYEDFLKTGYDEYKISSAVLKGNTLCISDGNDERFIDIESVLVSLFDEELEEKGILN